MCSSEIFSKIAKPKELLSDIAQKLLNDLNNDLDLPRSVVITNGMASKLKLNHSNESG